MNDIEDDLDHVRSRLQVNVPLNMLMDGYLETFIGRGLNPEIGLDAAALERWAPEALRPVADAFRALGRTVTLHGPFIDLSPGSTDAGIRALTRRRFAQLADMARVFRPKTVVCHGGYDRWRYSYFRDRWRESSLEIWRWLAGALSETGSRLMLENVYERTPEEALFLISPLAADGVGWCLDIGHMNAFGERPAKEWLDGLGPYIGQMHLHDNDGGWDDHAPLGTGSIDLAQVMGFLHRRAGAPPVLTLEPHREEDLAPSLEYLAAHWPWKAA